MTSRLSRERGRPARPTSVPAWLIRLSPPSPRFQAVQSVCSFFRRIIRSTLKPQVCGPSPGRIAQGAERDGELRRPPLFRPPGRDLPDAPPVRVVGGALVGDQAVVLRPVRVGGEDEGVAAVLEGVEDEDHGVVAGQAGPTVEALDDEGVALEDAGDDPVGLAVEGPHPDVEGLVVVEDGHLGGLGGGLPLPRLPLAEVGRLRAQSPTPARRVDRPPGSPPSRAGRGRTAPPPAGRRPPRRGEKGSKTQERAFSLGSGRRWGERMIYGVDPERLTASAGL